MPVIRAFFLFSISCYICRNPYTSLQTFLFQSYSLFSDCNLCNFSNLLFQSVCQQYPLQNKVCILLWPLPHIFKRNKIFNFIGFPFPTLNILNGAFEKDSFDFLSSSFVRLGNFLLSLLTH